MDYGPLPIVFFSKERWDSGGRSCELSTRFAGERSVVLLERPSAAEPGVPDSWDLVFPMRQLLVGRPVLTHGSSAAAQRLPGMIRQLMRWQDIGDWIAWLDAPSFFPLARGLAPRLVAYDCAAPAALLPAGASPGEAELVRTADLLFLGEPRADRCSWDGLAAHMLEELARAERSGRRRPVYEQAAVAISGGS
jgi:hypothetical protein